MLTPADLARIKELAAKQRDGLLTDTERQEQAKLRQQYIDQVKNFVRLNLQRDCPQGCSCGKHHH